MILALARAVESRDGYTIQHAERVALYAREMGRAYGLGGEDLDVLYKGGMLHDVGKIAVPEAVLLKPGPLDEAESASMRTHAAEGERICVRSAAPRITCRSCVTTMNALTVVVTPIASRAPRSRSVHVS